MVLGERSDGRIDREKTCPLLLRIFINQIYHNRIKEYSHKSFPSNELRAYTWLDATLLELSDLIKSVHTDAQKAGTVFEFAIVSPDPDKPFYRMRNIGSICSGFPADSDKIMLKRSSILECLETLDANIVHFDMPFIDCTFRIGDMLDVSITPPPTNPSMPVNAMATSVNKRRRNEEPVGAPQQSSRRMGGGGGRDRFHPYGNNNSRQRRNFM
ncbi:unnamed protein product [Hymenolepis diminuta]|uniref:18 kDa Sin3-associated polypeptide n=1 Tax=Hymenolepis diminuta TaxID=6216 RepID=A0A0R3SRH2_HYMDI|nr:unnamed protein product [Hymenolepis diminuta]